MIRASLLFALLLPAFASAESLDAKLKSLSPGQWLSYDVPLQPGVHTPCCLDWDGHRTARPGVCRLGDRDWNFGHSDDDPVAPPGSTLRVLARRGDQGFDRLRVVGSACEIDANGATVVEAEGVTVDQSLAWLGGALARDGRQRNQAIMAIAHHAGPQADRMLSEAAHGESARLRRDATFWLADARGEFGYRTVRELIDGAPREDELNHLVFALSISPVPAARDDLRRLARTHRDDEVRGEALFWLAQGNDAQAEPMIEAALDDPSDRVRKKAVFALSQLPAERAVPALRELVEHGASREVRKEALFWLAQVDDDAVLPVFDQLLGESK
jgi:hypothetical protein